MCTKLPYANRRLAKRALAKLRASGQKVRAIHPRLTDHPGAWHITSKKARAVRLGAEGRPAWWRSAATQRSLYIGTVIT